LEENLFGLDGAGKVEEGRNKDQKGSGIGQLFQSAIMMLGKVPKSRIRSLIEANAGVEPPFPITEDMDTHVNTAIDCIWSAKDGDWEEFYTYLHGELKEAADEATAHLKSAAKSASDMSEGRVKDLLRKYGGPNAVPKLRVRRGTGTVSGQLERGDYIAALIDLLRDRHNNDYAEVAAILERDNKSTQKKGFTN